MQKETLSRCVKLLLLILLPIVLYAIPAESVFNGKSICVFTNIFGIECWGCGITRAIFSALYFRFTEAWEYNRLVVIVLPLLMFEWLKAVIQSLKFLLNNKK